ncbi:MAG: hypothetical protein V8T26_09975 [[Eubacterium] siraeum]
MSNEFSSKVTYGGLYVRIICIWVDDKGKLVMRIQLFSTDNNSVTDVAGIYPSELLYALALEHRMKIGRINLWLPMNSIGIR